jgi:Zn finger protein HypA/HybF involved in hydrogenase expression
MIAGLNKEEMTCWCPSCGELVDVDNDEIVGYDENSIPEYWVYCPECHQSFYVSENYNS